MNALESAPPAESTPAPATVWTIKSHDVCRAFTGGTRLATSLLFRTAGPAPEVVARANAIGRTAVHEKFRASVDVKEPKLAHFLKLQAESAVLSRDCRRVTAKLATLRASREEALLEAAPGFSAQVVQLDAQIADLQGQATASADAAAAIAQTTATARDEVLRGLATIAANVTAKEHAALRRRREELVAALPEKIGAILSELAALDRAVMLSPVLPAHLDAMLDELATATPPEAAPAVSLVMQAEAGHFVVGAPEAANTQPEAAETAPEDVPAVEAAPESVSEAGRCQHAKTDGSRCRGRALPGLAVCVLHRRVESRTEAVVMPATA